MNEKLRILAVLKGVKNLDKDLYHALGADLEVGMNKLLEVLKQVPNPSNKVLTAAKKLLESDNPLVKKAAMDFLDSNKL
jgi:hypothetical protein